MKNRKIKKVSRRKFNGGLMAAGLAGPAALTPQLVEAENSDGDALQTVAAISGLLLLAIGTKNYRVKQLVMIFAAGAIVLSLSSKQKLTPLNKIPAALQPGILFGTTAIIAQAFFLNSTIFLVMTGNLPGFRNLNMMMYPRGPKGDEFATQKKFRVKPKKVKNLPSVAQIRANGRRIGDLRASSSNRNMALQIRGLSAQV